MQDPKTKLVFTGKPPKNFTQAHWEALADTLRQITQSLPRRGAHTRDVFPIDSIKSDPEHNLVGGGKITYGTFRPPSEQDSKTAINVYAHKDPASILAHEVGHAAYPKFVGNDYGKDLYWWGTPTKKGKEFLKTKDYILDDHDEYTAELFARAIALLRQSQQVQTPETAEEFNQKLQVTARDWPQLDKMLEQVTARGPYQSQRKTSQGQHPLGKITQKMDREFVGEQDRDDPDEQYLNMAKRLKLKGGK